MINRALYSIAFSEDWGRQMRFITGPRQSGKTTLAKQKFTVEKDEALYYLWDLRSIRNRYKENELFFTSDKMPDTKKHWLCFDELHKMPQWKNILKAIYDSSFENYNFIITGSAKFGISRKAGDSLSGRYFTFHLMPLCLGEVLNSMELLTQIPKNVQELIDKIIQKNNFAKIELNSLLEYSGFPEPFINQSKNFFLKWSQDYLDTVIKEDISILTNISGLEKIFDLYNLLPEMTGSPISESSLASHLEISSPTIKNYLRKLEDFFLSFRIYPYSKNIKRSLLKASKCYLFNWSFIQDPAKRFENYIAVELNTLISLWNDMGGKLFSFYYIRDKQKQETDFLITKNQIPWLLIETKLSDSKIDKHHIQTQQDLGTIPVIQLCQQENISQMQGKNIYRISASRFY